MKILPKLTIFEVDFDEEKNIFERAQYCIQATVFRFQYSYTHILGYYKTNFSCELCLKYYPPSKQGLLAEWCNDKTMKIATNIKTLIFQDIYFIEIKTVDFCSLLVNNKLVKQLQFIDIKFPYYDLFLDKIRTFCTENQLNVIKLQVMMRWYDCEVT